MARPGQKFIIGSGGPLSTMPQPARCQGTAEKQTRTIEPKSNAVMGVTAMYQQDLKFRPPKAKEIRQRSRFAKYHQDNPQIYAAFSTLIHKAIDRGRKYYGAKALMEIIRWQTEIEGSGIFKINNNYTSRYARMWEANNPQHEGFFRKRRLSHGH